MSSRPPANDVLLTGAPRSGTTLACHLLNRVANTVALLEPMRGNDLVRRPRKACVQVEAFCTDTRRAILLRGLAPSKHVDGVVPTNSMSDRADASGLRASRAARGEIRIGKPLTPDFTLVIKHPSAFTALLANLKPRFPVFAIIRNPLAVLASWNSVALPKSRGVATLGERSDPRLASVLERLSDVSERQLAMLSWYFARYRDELGEAAVVRYEEIVASRGRALAAITPAAQALDVALESHNANPLYDRARMRRLGKRLLDSDGAYWSFYSKPSVEVLMGG